MMTYYAEKPEMGVSILSGGVGKPFSVRPPADDDFNFSKNISFLLSQWNPYILS